MSLRSPNLPEAGRDSSPEDVRSLAGSVSPDGTDPAPSLPYPWIEGEGEHRLKGVDWNAVADGLIA